MIATHTARRLMTNKSGNKKKNTGEVIMAKVLIAYATDYGGTKKMAEAIAEWVNSMEGAATSLKPPATTALMSPKLR